MPNANPFLQFNFSALKSDKPAVWDQQFIAEFKRWLNLNAQVNPSLTGLSPLVTNVKDFGASGDGVSDDTSPVQAAINAATGILFFPPGDYLLDTVTISQELVVLGSGRRFQQSIAGTRINAKSATSTIFYVNTPDPVTFLDLGFINNNGATAGAAIQLDDTGASGTGNLFSRIENCLFDGMFTGVRTTRASSVTVSACQFWNVVSTGFGIFIDNLFNADQGDDSIDACTFGIGIGNAVGIGWQGSGGLRVFNNKFLGSRALSINLGGVPVGQPTAQLYITGNSFDGVTNSGIPVNIFNAAGLSPFFGITIVGNQFNCTNLDTFIVISGNSGHIVSNVAITGNTLYVYAGNTVSGQGGISLDFVADFTITGNVIKGVGTATGILVSANCATGYISSNFVNNWATKIGNSSGTVTVGANY